MKNLCPLCRVEHTRNECPKLKPGQVSHGNPRQNLHPVTYTPPLPKPPRPSMFRDRSKDKPTPPTLPFTKTHTMEIQTVTKTVTKTTPEVSVTPPVSVTPSQKSKRGRPPSGKALTPAEKQRAYRARKTPNP